MLVACAGLALASGTFAGAPRVDRLVWRSGDSFYVATADSGALRPGMQVCLNSAGREVACGIVTQVLDGRVASVRRTRGDLPAWDGSLPSFDVEVSSPEPRTPGTLRIGLPAARRDNGAFAGSNAGLDRAVLGRPYRVDTLGAASFRLVALDSTRAADAWPETLEVRRYADRADEEIALERGELDLAVFRPGEAPASLRAPDPRFERLRAPCTRGAIVLVVAPRDTMMAAEVTPDLAAINRQVFADDLAPWSDTRSAEPLARVAPLRFIVDPGLPGPRAIARVLAARRPEVADRSARPVTLAFRDVDVTNPDSLARAWRPHGILPVFTIRCPVVCRAERAEAVRRLGPGAFADLAACSGVERAR